MDNTQEQTFIEWAMLRTLLLMQYHAHKLTEHESDIERERRTR